MNISKYVIFNEFIAEEKANIILLTDFLHWKKGEPLTENGQLTLQVVDLVLTNYYLLFSMSLLETSFCYNFWFIEVNFIG